MIFAPLFNKLDVFERLAAIDLLKAFPKIQAWSAALAARPSVSDTTPLNQAETLLTALGLQDAYAMRTFAK